MSRELLREKMATLIRGRNALAGRSSRDIANAILSLLSDPANITDEMVTRFSEAFDDPKLPGETTHEQAIKIGISAAFSERAPSDLTKEPKP